MASASDKTDYTLPEMLIDEMNPAWKEKNGSIDKPNEKVAAWLCDTSQWTTYAILDDSTQQSKVNYAIGGPSMEMYVDSYNEAKT